MLANHRTGPPLLAFLVAVSAWGTPVHGQGPAVNLNNPQPTPDWIRQPAPAGPSGGPPPSVLMPAVPAPPGMPYSGPMLQPGGNLEPASPAAPRPDLGTGVPGSTLDTTFGGRGGFSPFMSPVVGVAPIRTDYRVTWLGSEPVSGQPTNLGYVRQDVILAFPIWQNGTCDEWTALANFRNENYHTHAILPSTGRAFPEDLWAIQVGTTYRHLFDNGWIGGATVTVGSISDQPFHSINEMTAGVNAFLRVPSGERNAWLFSLSYSPASELPIPVPGVAYIWQPSDTFRANIGLPFIIDWRPMEDLTLDFSYMLLTTIHAQATYRLSRGVRLYGAYAWENEAYLLADRTDHRDRFFNVDQRLTAGVLFAVSEHVALDLSGGYVFDHYYFEGRNIVNGTNFNRVDVGAGPYLALQARIRW